MQIQNRVNLGNYKSGKPADGEISSFYKFGTRVSGGINKQALPPKQSVLGSDKYFKQREVNLGPKDIAHQAKQTFEKKQL